MERRREGRRKGKPRRRKGEARESKRGREDGRGGERKEDNLRVRTILGDSIAQISSLIHAPLCGCASMILGYKVDPVH